MMECPFCRVGAGRLDVIFNNDLSSDDSESDSDFDLKFPAFASCRRRDKCGSQQNRGKEDMNGQKHEARTPISFFFW